VAGEGRIIRRQHADAVEPAHKKAGYVAKTTLYGNGKERDPGQLLRNDGRAVQFTGKNGIAGNEVDGQINLDCRLCGWRAGDGCCKSDECGAYISYSRAHDISLTAALQAEIDEQG
jgi:hypothetical protein